MSNNEDQEDEEMRRLIKDFDNSFSDLEKAGFTSLDMYADPVGDAVEPHYREIQHLVEMTDPAGLRDE